MAYDNPGGGGGGSDMFSDGPMGSPEKMGEKDSPGDGQTAILPKSILAGKEFKPGDEVVLRIVNMHENDVEVEYAPEEPEKEEGMEPGSDMAPAEAAPPGGGSSMASMME
jgi:hypothetical protein